MYLDQQNNYLWMTLKGCESAPVSNSIMGARSIEVSDPRIPPLRYGPWISCTLYKVQINIIGLNRLVGTSRQLRSEAVWVSINLCSHDWQSCGLVTQPTGNSGGKHRRSITGKGGWGPVRGIYHTDANPTEMLYIVPLFASRKRYGHDLHRTVFSSTD